jgi:hypothetical protein
MEMRDDVLDVITKPIAGYIAEEMSRHFSKYETGIVVTPIFPAPQNIAPQPGANVTPNTPIATPNVPNVTPTAPMVGP